MEKKSIHISNRWSAISANIILRRLLPLRRLSHTHFTTMCDDAATNNRIIANLLDQIDALKTENDALEPVHAPKIGSNSLLQVKPNMPAVLDPDFFPFVLGSRNYMKVASATSGTTDFHVAVERHQGLTSAFTVPCFPKGHANFDDSCIYIERKIKFILWQKGGYKLHVSGNKTVCKYLSSTYSASGSRSFDVDLMAQAYNEPFQTFVHSSASQMPAQNENSLDLGGNLDGNRIGFDLGGSDFKLAAIKDGEAIFTTEIPWDPYNQPDPEVHWEMLNKGLKMIEEKLGGHVDAIGGSSAGVLVDNEFRIASLFRSVPKDKFDSFCRPMMKKLEEEWGVPVMCINDGEVTALAGGQSLGKNALLGIAMGTSEAVGYLDANGKVTSWLNELAFAPVDFSTSEANMDEWSGDVGVGCMYFSQQAVNKLAGAAGYTFDDDLKLPKRLIKVQEAQKAGEAGAAKIYESIGTYLGYSTASYAEFYDGLENVMILGRVTSGSGCDIILAKAREVLAQEFPELKIEFHVPDEKMKRVGQSVAAASLPESKKGANPKMLLHGTSKLDANMRSSMPGLDQ